jgi:hypothetical protein
MKHILLIAERAPNYALTPGRLGAITAVLVALTGSIVGGLALARARRTGDGLRGGIVALAAGLFGIAVGALIVATAGGLGTGGGLAGGVVALVVGSISVVLGGLARARSRRTGG